MTASVDFSVPNVSIGVVTGAFAIRLEQSSHWLTWGIIINNTDSPVTADCDEDSQLP